MSSRNNKFLVSVCVFSLVSNLGSNISFAMKEKSESDDDVSYSNESEKEKNESKDKGIRKQDPVNRYGNQMKKELYKNNNNLSDIFGVSDGIKKTHKNYIENEEEVKDELNFLGLSYEDYKSSGDINTERNKFEDITSSIKMNKEYKEYEGYKSEPEYNKIKRNEKLSSKKIFLEEESKKNCVKNKSRKISNPQNNKRNKNSFVTPQKRFASYKPNESSQYKSGTLIKKNGNYSKDSKDKSPCTKFSNNKMKYYTTINKNNNGYGSNNDEIKLNLKNSFLGLEKGKYYNAELVKMNNGNENFYDHLREIFAEHPKYKFAVPVMLFGVFVVKGAFDL